MTRLSDIEMDALRHGIERCATDTERWDLICTPEHVEDCQELEKFTVQVFPYFLRPTNPQRYMVDVFRQSRKGGGHADNA